jgi:hypothetical protein
VFVSIFTYYPVMVEILEADRVCEQDFETSAVSGDQSWTCTLSPGSRIKGIRR